MFRFIAAGNLSPIKPGGLPHTTADNGAITNIEQILFGILGGMALLVIVIAGLRFITSAGDTQKTANARNTILFALVGLIIAVSAEAIINFVVNRT